MFSASNHLFVSHINLGTNYSHVGLIVEMPNPFTDARELFLLEATQNKDNLIDAFFQVKIILFYKTKYIISRN